MKGRKAERQMCSLGELIVELYDQAKKVCSSEAEQNVMVYEALQHILSTRIRRDLRMAS